MHVRVVYLLIIFHILIYFILHLMKICKQTSLSYFSKTCGSKKLVAAPDIPRQMLFLTLVV